ncbi:gamma-glutamylcyclotransferase [Bacillus sp. S/N-304-OC-R1]|uniref:gamma-glutamylcyclotransferase n=1 Tax=Bacillus sp. S/N-304-OC-R1 TaxID=2758034 RepID=UPI001C8D4512|nr:gamma-glutamylcyclotransferase family protein [Bacillus sp. S/N-304-OC-R1]MBY0121451.1 gamma-glutamylcyclotransferase [Bacillus sp. S/N-304-OC-R1]
MEQKYLVFVYGTLRANERNHELLRGSTCIAQQAWTAGIMFDTGKNYPALIRNSEGRVYGELYEITWQQLANLDNLEGYNGEGQNNLYDRAIQKIYTDHGDYEAYVYIMDTIDPDSNEISSGDWKVYRYLNEETLYYYAYGSCMDDARFKIANVSHYFQNLIGRGMLEGYSLGFTYKAHDGGRADIVEGQGVVEGKVYQVPSEAIPYLYAREGVKTSCYRPAIVEIKMENERVIEALTFIVVNKQSELPPPAHYLEEIIRGGTGLFSDEYMENLKGRFPEIIEEFSKQ